MSRFFLKRLSLVSYVSLGTAFWLTTGCFACAQLPEIAVIRFEGETRRLDVDLPKQTVTPSLRILVADTLQNSVWLYTREQKTDAIHDDAQSEENLWSIGGANAAFAFQKETKAAMWSLSNTALFVDPFGLEVRGSQKGRIATIASACTHGRLKMEPAVERLGDMVYRRTAVDDLGLVSKKFRDRIPLSSSWIEAIVDHAEFEVQSVTLYDEGKPVEIIRGEISVKRQDSIPIEILEFLAKLASHPLHGPWLSLVGEWEVVLAASPDMIGKTLQIGETNSFKFLPANPLFGGSKFLPIDYDENEKAYRYLFEGSDDSPDVGGGGPRKSMCRIDESGDLEIIEARSAGDDYPKDFSEAFIAKSVYLKLKKKPALEKSWLIP